MKHYTLYNIHKATRSLLLAAGLLLAGGVAWGQTFSTDNDKVQNRNPNDLPTDEVLEEIIKGYATSSGFLNLYNAAGSFTRQNAYVDKFKQEGDVWIIDIMWGTKENIGNPQTSEQRWPSGVTSTTCSSIELSSANIDNISGQARKVIYAYPGEPKNIMLQEAGGSDNMDGFLHWYLADEKGNILDSNPTAGLKWSETETGGFQFKNGLAWLRNTTTTTTSSNSEYLKLCIKSDNGSTGWVPFNGFYQYSDWYPDGDKVEKKFEDSPDGASTVTYTIPNTAQDGDTYYLVCEASASNNSSFDDATDVLTTPEIALKYIYEIRVCTSDRFTSTTSPFNGTNLSTAAISSPENYFLEDFEIHTPIPTGTNYRLSEPLENYYVENGSSISSPNCIRWRMFDSAGNPAGGTFEGKTTSEVVLYKKDPNDNNDDDDHDALRKIINIIKYKFPVADGQTERKVYYITAEVGYSSNVNTPSVPSAWYPVSLQKVYLEPFSEPLTQATLDSIKNGIDTKGRKAADYQNRFESYLTEHRYEEIEVISFEETKNDTLANAGNALLEDIELNYSKSPMANVNSYYAFADLADYAYRKDNRLSVGRGEYALYRTLNYPGISAINVMNSGGGKYTDYFMSQGSYTNKQMVDRLWEKTDGLQSGYFMYLDATDDPGVITQVKISGLCPNTTLLMSAWVCDMAHSAGAEHADVGFTIKRLNKGTKEYEVLTRYYSGVVSNSPAIGSNDTQANWQQIFFQFTFNEGLYEDEYLLEIANNTPSSNGADYGIDEIKFYKSTPDISVRRESACTASTLIVSSDYETLMRNMGWDDDPDVLSGLSLLDPDVRKYRYGLMGDDPYTTDPHEHIGNMYYSITEKNLEDESVTGGSSLEDWITLNKALLEKGVADNDEILKNLSKSMRVAIPTDLNLPPESTPEHGVIPTGDDAIQLARYNEFTLNLRAINDFISDTGDKSIYNEETGEYETHTIWKESELNGKVNVSALQEALKDLCTVNNATGNNKTGTINVTEEQCHKLDSTHKNYDPELYKKYEDCLLEVYSFLGIPRIYCPWLKTVDSRKILCLGSIDVNNTDLRFKDEIIDDNGNKASGKYHVVVFNAEQVHKGSVVNFSNKCLLHSPFTVQPSFNLAINTDMMQDGAGCEGYITEISAELLVEEVDEAGNVIGDLIPFEDAYTNGVYTFDWFIGTFEEYEAYNEKVVSPDFSRNLQLLIKGFRDSKGTGDNRASYFTEADIRNSDFYNTYQDDAELLISLLGDVTASPKLIVGDGKKASQIRWPECVVAIPYVPDIKTGDNNYQFCAEPQERELDVNASPDLSVGFPNMTYPDLTDVPLRLGMRHIQNESSLVDVPIRKNIEFGSQNAKSLGMPYVGDVDMIKDVYLYHASQYKVVGRVTELFADETNGGQLSITFNDNLDDSYFHEGDTCLLYVPFGEYSDENTQTQQTQIPGSCGGYARLQIKIVPEYLTWKGNAETDEVWYNDKNWKQSTKSELYMGEEDSDANGSDDVNKAFSPLYFTKITINPQESAHLTLEDKTSSESSSLEPTQGKDATENIQYDMAVDTVLNPAATDPTVRVVPYYINKVNEIYFKPNATLMNQHLLKYDTARVEFTLTKGDSYWMASPLKAVYAGDMYAPIGNGKQETPAFDYITFDYSESGTNHRWKLPFYQKAWDKAVAYVNSGDAHSTENAIDVEAVQSNWSIEYNDVWVPYNIGKGYYMRVESDDTNISNVTVRLPKADKEYSYQATKAGDNLSKVGSRDLAGELAGKSGSADTTIALNVVDGDDNHFLVGNPYMTYLNMDEFFKENAADQDPVLNKKYWTIEEGTTKAVVGTPDVEWTGESTTGFIPPMTAFFVERYTEPVETTKAEGDATTEPTTISVKFTTGMMATKATATKASPATRSVSATAPVLTLTAERDGKKGRSVITLRDKAENAYKASEDAVVLLDSELDAPVAYSVAGNRAAQVNALRSIDNIPVGVYSSREGEVSVTIEGMDQLAEPLYLYDAHTRKSTLLEGDSYTLELSGESHGRYYLRSSAIGSVEDDAIAVYSVQSGKVVVASTGEVRNIKVYSLSGAMVKNYMNLNTPQHVFHLPAGAYVVHAEGKDGAVKVEKVMVR